jgi:hypothetical protein
MRPMPTPIPEKRIRGAAIDLLRYLLQIDKTTKTKPASKGRRYTK